MKTIELINILLEQRDCKRYQNLDDLFELLRIYEPEDMVHAHRLNKVVRDVSVKQSKNAFYQYQRENVSYNCISVLFYLMRR